MNEADELLTLAGEVADELEARGTVPLVIGAIAMAARGFERATKDLDFAVNLTPNSLRALAECFDAKGISATFREPDGDDPLGGVLVLERGDSRVEVVSFNNPPSGGFPRLVDEANENAEVLSGLPGVVATTIDLILFKLYASGPKSRNDILHLLEVAKVDLEEVTRRAKTARVLEKEWSRILRDLNDE